MYEMLTGECFDDPSLPSGAQLRVEEFALNYNHPLEAIFALHDKGIYEEVAENFNMWGVMSIYKDRYKQSIQEIRNYYGTINFLTNEVSGNIILVIFRGGNWILFCLHAPIRIYFVKC